MSVYESERERERERGFPSLAAGSPRPSLFSDGRMRSTTGEKCSLKEKQREVAAVGLATRSNLSHGFQ